MSSALRRVYGMQCVYPESRCDGHAEFTKNSRISPSVEFVRWPSSVLTSHCPTGPDLKAAYNRAAWSHMFKEIRVFVEDNSGVRHTTGSEASTIVQLQLKFAYWTPSLLAAASPAAQASWAALNEIEMIVSTVPMTKTLAK